RAGPAAGGVAADVGAGEAEPVPQEVHQQQPWLDLGRALLPVDDHGDLHRSPPSGPPGLSLSSSITPPTVPWPLKYSCRSVASRASSVVTGSPWPAGGTGAPTAAAAARSPRSVNTRTTV